MLQDVVVDTNVFMHAGNDSEARQADAIAFLDALLACTTMLNVDEGFAAQEHANSSYIWAEYLNQIQESTVGRIAIAHLAQTERIKPVSRAVSAAQNRRINVNVRDRSDRVFVKVAINAEEKLLVSHDFAAFSQQFRSAGVGGNGCSIVDAGGALPWL